MRGLAPIVMLLMVLFDRAVKWVVTIRRIKIYLIISFNLIQKTSILLLYRGYTNSELATWVIFKLASVRDVDGNIFGLDNLAITYSINTI